MILNIPLIKLSEMFCEEAASASIATWLNRNYEMMYVDALRFKFDYDAAVKTGFIGDKLFSGLDISEMYKNLEFYHGITARLANDIDYFKVVEILEEKKSPVGLGIPARYCDFSQTEQSLYLLLVGYDEGCFYCYDIHSGEPDVKRLPFSSVAKAQENGDALYVVYEVNETKDRNLSLHTFVEHFKPWHYTNNYDIKKQMLLLAECIKSFMDISVETAGYANYFDAPIFLGIVNVMRSRKLMSNMFQYVYSVTGDQNADIIAYYLADISRAWKKIWAMLQKLYLKKYQKGDKEYFDAVGVIVEAIENVATYEENITNQILAEEFDFGDIGIRQMVKWNDDSMVLFEEIDINHFYNNKSFSSSRDNAEGADISGNGEFFVLSCVNEIELNVLKKKIRLPIRLGECDNISCGGEVIVADGKKCKGLAVIACAEWQDCMSEIIVEAGDKKTKLIFEVPDWYNYRGSIYCSWIGNAIDFQGNEEKRGIFSFVYELPMETEIEKIYLPQNPNIHVYKIYMFD